MWDTIKEVVEFLATITALIASLLAIKDHFNNEK